MAAEDRVHDLRYDGVVVTDDTRKQRFTCPKSTENILAKLLFHAPALIARFSQCTNSSNNRRFQMRVSFRSTSVPRSMNTRTR